MCTHTAERKSLFGLEWARPNLRPLIVFLTSRNLDASGRRRDGCFQVPQSRTNLRVPPIGIYVAQEASMSLLPPQLVRGR